MVGKIGIYPHRVASYRRDQSCDKERTKERTRGQFSELRGFMWLHAHIYLGGGDTGDDNKEEKKNGNLVFFLFLQ